MKTRLLSMLGSYNSHMPEAYVPQFVMMAWNELAQETELRSNQNVLQVDLF